MSRTDSELVERFPGILLDEVNRAHYEGILEGRLLISRCRDCGTWHHPPRPVCPSCWSDAVEPTEPSGRGRIHLLILLHQGPPAEGVDYSTPHPVATVELAEQPGLRYTATVVGRAPEALRIGDPVELTWSQRAGRPLPVFRVAASTGPPGEPDGGADGATDR